VRTVGHPNDSGCPLLANGPRGCRRWRNDPPAAAARHEPDLTLAAAPRGSNRRGHGRGGVSTEEQSTSGAGLAAQRAAIEAECLHRGWHLIEVIEDAGFSAKDMKRPGVKVALETLEQGDACALVVAKLDRLSRSMIDFTTVMATASKQGWALVALDCAVDTSTPAGEAMANVLATFAQFERRLIGQRTREALAAKRASGVRLGRPVTLPVAGE
jgi:DNA invertase Pin-like site-specific DNA recombinase